jgi:hypothetical protein
MSLITNPLEQQKARIRPLEAERFRPGRQKQELLSLSEGHRRDFLAEHLERFQNRTKLTPPPIDENQIRHARSLFGKVPITA